MGTNITNDDLAALVIQSAPGPVGKPITFRPIRPVLPVRPLPPIGTPVKPILPPKLPSKGANPSGKNGIPLALLTVFAVQSPVKQQSYVDSDITCSWTYNIQDPNYYAVNIWFVGYHGKSTPQLMASGTQAPLNFLCDATGETVSVYFQTVSSTGANAPIQFAAHTTVALSGKASAPPAPTISQSLVGTPTGFQFGFNQVVLPTGDEEVIACYKIYRSTLDTFSSASLHSTLTPAPTNLGAITYTDTVNDATGAFYYYWVTAVNTQKFESTATPAQSGPVLGSIGSTPVSMNTPFTITTTTSSVTIKTTPSAFFTRADGTTTTIGQTTTACTGLPQGNNLYFFPCWDEPSQTLKFVKNTDATIPPIIGVTFAAASSQYIETTTGASIPAAFTVEMWVKGSTAGALFDFSAPRVGGVTTASIIQCQITSGGEVEFAVYNGSTWANVTTSGATMLDSTWHLVLVSYASGSATIYVDGVYTSNGSTFWTNNSIGTPASTTGYWHFGFVGGIAGAPLTSDTYNGFTLSNIALYDVALNYVQAANHLVAYTSLGQATYELELTYDGAVNYWELDETSGTTAADSVGSNTGTYVGGPTLNQTSASITVLGTPAIAWPYNSMFALQQQFLRNHVPLSSGGMLASTNGTGTSSGGTGGGYTGGGGRGGLGGCFSENTKLSDGIPISEHKVGDIVWVKKDDDTQVLRKIRRVNQHVDCLCLLTDMGGGELVTVGHLMRKGEGWVRAEMIWPDFKPAVQTVWNLEIETDQEDERNYVLANGHCAHNMMITKTA